MNPSARRYRLAHVLPPFMALLAAGCFVEFPTGSGTNTNPECGNGVAEAGESCDGADLAGRTCQSLLLGPGLLACRPDCTGFDTSGCGLPGCGDGIQAGSEVCDGADLAGETCASIGYGPGDLACQANCTDFDTAGCTLKNDGDPCTENEQCAGGECWTEETHGWPGGYCVGECPPGACPGGGVCVHHLSAEIFICQKPCVDSSDCRRGYACFTLFQGEPTVCWAHCTIEEDCPLTGACNLWMGLCAVDVAGEDNGAECTQGAQCKGFMCRTDLPEGYCISNCSLYDGFCPGDGVCVDVFNGTMGDLGDCMDGCVDPADCRSGYDCYEDAITNDRYCYPP